MMEELGSGFYLAMHDLEIRGAGEVLGENQSGEMQEVGFQLYNDMLRARCASLKAGREPDLAEPLGVATEINLHVPALLPERTAATCTSGCAVQAAGDVRDGRGARRHAGGDHRPLRRHPRAGAGAARHAIGCACWPSRSARARSMRVPRARPIQFVKRAALRPRRLDPSRPARRANPLRRTGPDPDRARGAHASGAHCTREGIPGQARVAGRGKERALQTATPPHSERSQPPPHSERSEEPASSRRLAPYTLPHSERSQPPPHSERSQPPPHSERSQPPPHSERSEESAID